MQFLKAWHLPSSHFDSQSLKIQMAITGVEQMRQINNWDDANARREATRAFCVYLHRAENVQAREKCKIDPVYARSLFAELGGFCLAEELTADEANPIVPI